MLKYVSSIAKTPAVKLKRSLSARLLAIFIIASLMMSILLFAVIAHGFAQQWRVNARPHIEQYLDFINAEIGNPPNINNARALADRLPVNIYIVGPDTNYSTTGKAFDFEEESFNRPQLRDRPYKQGKRQNNNIQFSGDEDRTMLKSVVGDYQVYYELTHRRNAKHRRSLILPALFIMLGSLAICFLIIRRMLKPVRDIKLGVKKMGGGDLAYRVPVRHDNDLGQLAGSINTMASDIEQMLDAKRQLLLGASHELRSPLTRAKVATQLLPISNERQRLEDDLLEMEFLIADILESERMKSGHAALQRQSVDLKKLVQSVIGEMAKNTVGFECQDKMPECQLDDTRIRIMLRNLIGNAIKHSDVTESLVTVSLSYTDKLLTINVVDKGQGIAAEHIEHVTEPFYRADASRTRSTGGFGLGLHLASLIAQAHGGKLSIESCTADMVQQGETSGTHVSVQIPCNATAL